MEETIKKCTVSKKCGGCQYQGVSYQEQLAAKQKKMNKLLKKFGNVKPIIGIAISILTAIATTLGVTSCMG